MKGRGWLVGCRYIPEDLGEKWPHSRGNGLVNIPVPWILWVCLEDVSWLSVGGYSYSGYIMMIFAHVSKSWDDQTKVGDKVWSRLESSGWSQLPSRDYPKKLA